jgi:hypothetical protein
MKIESFQLPLPAAPATQTITSIGLNVRLKLDVTLVPILKAVTVRVAIDDVQNPVSCDWYVLSAPCPASNSNKIRPPDAVSGLTGYWITSDCCP